MRQIADLHVHGRFSRATSREGDLEHFAIEARRKGISLLGTGDFTHPAWRASIRESLMDPGSGLLQLRPELEARLLAESPARLAGTIRFVLSVEISTIYKRDGRTRKVHHLALAPDFDAMDAFVARLARVGNLASDGRPILGLDSRDLLETALESGRGCVLVPAHIWTPWFAALGSMSGFDSLDACYADLAGHVFAAETGLSSDPPMNRRVSSLDRVRLLSSSDAHSPSKLGREATVFEGIEDFDGLLRAMREGHGYVGTLEFFPEEGKYHLDGHRSCGIRWSPEETLARGGLCGVCGKPVTVGVMHRVERLADRAEPGRPPTEGETRYLVPLEEILAELRGTGPKSQSVQGERARLLALLGPEIPLLDEVPIEDVERAGGRLLGEALRRLRLGQVHREAGFDGEYGVIRLFGEGELQARSGGRLFAVPDARRPPPVSPLPPRTLPEPEAPAWPEAALFAPARRSALEGLDEDQRAAASVLSGRLLVEAGPGSGKTRMLTHRVAHLVETGGVRPDACLVLTFTRRAAGELKQRLDELLPGQGSRVRVCTFHALACALLREFHREAGLPEAFAVLDERGHLLLLERALGITRAQARSLTERLSRARRDGSLPRDPELLRQATLRQAALSASGQLAFDDLVPGATRLLVEHPELAERLRQRWRHVSVDEYQDVDSAQVALLRLLVGPESSLCAIGDPRQAIYGFRGSDPACFQRFELDFEGAERRRLRRNYRSGRPIVGAANALMRESAVEAPMQPASTLAALPVVRVEAPSAAAEAGAVVHLIEGLLGGLAFFSRDSGRLAEHGFEGLSLDGSRSLAEIAVLFRAESVAEDLVQALDRAGLPFQRRRHGRLMDDERFASLVERLRSLGAGMPLLERLELACMEAARDLEGEEGVALRREQLLVLVRAHPEPASFFEAVELADEADTFDPRADRIALLTLHAAKGLEFSVVFLLGCEEGVLPLHWGREGEEGGEGGEDANDSIEEERRLFYVGMTRARERLFLCRAARRAWRGPPRDMAPSRFLRVLPDEFVTRWRPVGSTTGRLEPDRQLRLFP